MLITGDETDLPLDFGGASARDEPELAEETARAFEQAGLIGGEKLRADGVFVVNVKRLSAPASLPESPLVLIVEDDAGTSRTIETILKKRGFTTRTAANLQEILRGVNARIVRSGIKGDVFVLLPMPRRLARCEELLTRI